MTTPLPEKQSNQTSEATLKILEALEEMLCGSEITLGGIFTCIDKAINSCDVGEEKCLAKVWKKVLKCIDKNNVDCSNSLDFVFTKIISYLHTELESQYWLLTQLCLKCGVINIGGDISVVVNQQCEDMKGPEKCPTITLDCSGLMPEIKRLIDILAEIRNRMPPIIIENDIEIDADYVDPKYSDTVSYLPKEPVTFVTDDSFAGNNKYVPKGGLEDDNIAAKDNGKKFDSNGGLKNGFPKAV